jgi:biopolymer transport protein ExbB
MIQTDLPQELEAMATEPEGISTKFIDLAMKGGWIMIPILFLSVVAVYIFFDRYFAIKKAGRFDSGLLEKIKVYITSGKIDSAVALCRSNTNPTLMPLSKM